MSQLLQEQISRIHLIKIQRQMPAKFLGAPPQSSTGALQASNNAADTPGAPPQGNSVPVASEDNAIAGEVLLELDRGKNVRLWTSVQPLEILALYHATKFADSEYGAGCSLVFSKLFQGYSMLLEILRLSYAVGHHLNERGDETLRQQLLVIKKEINNFTSPIPLDKLVTYLHLRWSILRMRLQVSLHAAAYCLLGNPMLHPSMSSFFAMYHYYRRLSRYPHSGHALVCSTPVEVNFQSNSFSDLSLTERKLCTERLNEIESHLDDIFHQTNLESISIETALVNQVEFLKSTSKIMNMRFELLSVVGRRQPVKLSHVAPFLATYKAFVTAPAYKEFVINQRRKGSHVEDVNATRGAQIEFEKCQTAALRNTLLVAYTRSIMRCLRRVFDLMADERSDSLFNNRDAIVLPRPYLIHAYPVELREGDFAHKSTLFDDFSYELHAYSQQTLSLILQAMRDRGRILADERGALVEVDAASVFLVRREYLATAVCFCGFTCLN
ncbi:hypothetical protein BC828DRAFT_149812 [Blastocladiella britannica]|nr:hypothetical protein BC828DRAFT_149812 [Blastocladiella britannica]